MELRKRETTVTPEANDIGEAVKKILVNIDQALDDDGQITADEYGTIVLTALGELQTAVKDIKEVKTEAQKAPFALARGIIDPITEGVEQLLDKTGTEIAELDSEGTPVA